MFLKCSLYVSEARTVNFAPLEGVEVPEVGDVFRGGSPKDVDQVTGEGE